MHGVILWTDGGDIMLRYMVIDDIFVLGNPLNIGHMKGMDIGR